MFDCSEYSDADLLELVSNGNQEALDTLIHKYVQKVRIIARSFFLAGADSDDLIQEGMIGLLSAIKHYNPDKNASFSTFAETCIRNKIIDLIKKSEISAISIDEIKDLPDDHLSPEELIIERENYRDKLGALKVQLSSLESRVLELYLSGVSYSAIASALGRRTASIHNAIERIRIKSRNI